MFERMEWNEFAMSFNFKSLFRLDALDLVCNTKSIHFPPFATLFSFLLFWHLMILYLWFSAYSNTSQFLVIPFLTIESLRIFFKQKYKLPKCNANQDNWCKKDWGNSSANSLRRFIEDSHRSKMIYHTNLV